jgi:hypothetical protein
VRRARSERSRFVSVRRAGGHRCSERPRHHHDQNERSPGGMGLQGERTGLTDQRANRRSRCAESRCWHDSGHGRQSCADQVRIQGPALSRLAAHVRACMHCARVSGHAAITQWSARLLYLTEPLRFTTVNSEEQTPWLTLPRHKSHHQLRGERGGHCGGSAGLFGASRIIDLTRGYDSSTLKASGPTTRASRAVEGNRNTTTCSVEAKLPSRRSCASRIAAGSVALC